MARSIWTGAISFGLVNVPVKLYAAVSPKEVRFHMLHEKDGGRIRQKRYCSVGDHEVPFEELAKGYEISKDEYVMVTPEELDALDPKGTRTIDIQTFVDIAEIDPIFYDHPYNLAPERTGAKAYSLLHAAMSESHKAAIARMVLRTKQYYCALRPRNGALTMSTLLYGDEINALSELEELAELPKPNPRELQMAIQLIESLTGDFKPDEYKDEYRERVLELVHQKAEGQKPVFAAAPEKPAPVINLADALAKSLAAASGERRHRAEAAKKTAAPRKKKRSRGSK
ncbi:MAG: non-homologous end joining protein Ku [Myxococcaceae bacterium]